MDNDRGRKKYFERGVKEENKTKICYGGGTHRTEINAHFVVFH